MPLPCIAVLAAVASLVAQAPRTRSQVLLYPAAVMDTSDGKTDWEVNRQGDGSVIEAASFLVPANVSAVLRFYAQKLGATRTSGEEGGGPEADAVAPGVVTAVAYEVTFHELTDEHHQPDGAGEAYTLFGKDKRASLARVRPADEAGKWMESARFTWAARAANGDLTEFNLGVGDEGLGSDWKSYRLLTRISIEVTTHPLSCEGAQPTPALDALCEQRLRGRVVALAARPPMAADLGVSPYPGATFDAATTAGMSSAEERYAIYTTADPIAKVVAFYERTTGKKGQRMPDGESVLIAVKGSGPFPELGVMIQPRLPQYPPSVKAVITVRQAKPSR